MISLCQVERAGEQVQEVVRSQLCLSDTCFELNLRVLFHEPDRSRFLFAWIIFAAFVAAEAIQRFGHEFFA